MFAKAPPLRATRITGKIEWFRQENASRRDLSEVSACEIQALFCFPFVF
jgi:hypothetical protein